jgi:hypothetical protein
LPHGEQSNIFIEMIRALLKSFINPIGYDLVRRDGNFTREELDLMERVASFTMSSGERLAGLLHAVKYLAANQIRGDFVECGVWRGGSMMAAAHALLSLGDASRQLYLYDTFEGLPPPSDKDVAFDGTSAKKFYGPTAKKDDARWCIAGVEEVERNLHSTGYPKERIHLIKGNVQDTIPKHAPAEIALLRLDTDWYDSTRHELAHLYPRLSPNGVMIIDDYGHWQGARKAVDEFLAAQKFVPLLNRLDYTGRLLIKPSGAGG